MVEESKEDIVSEFTGEPKAVAKEGVGVVAKARRDMVEKPKEEWKAVVKGGVGGVVEARQVIVEKSRVEESRGSEERLPGRAWEAWPRPVKS